MIPEGYEKIKIVGKGAFGTAVLYRRLNDNSLVVFKEIITLNLDNNEKKNSVNEIQVLAKLKHENIIRYLGSFKRDDALIIIMEYADGGNLAQLINNKKTHNEIFTEKGILMILAQITAAVSYMHASKILHRDLKTANIFLNSNGVVKVGDFGISKMLNTKSQAHTVVGTPYYLSPEMCEGMDYNEKSDIWAIGCILYELTTLKRPFDAQTLPVLIKQIMNCEYNEIPKNYSQNLSQLVKQILQKNYLNRPSAKLMNDFILPKLLKNSTETVNFTTNEPIRSIIYELQDFNDDLQVTPIDLPHKKFIKFTSSQTHQIAIASDNSIYVWGENNYGQLGLGVFDKKRTHPVCLKTVNETKFTSILAGNGFSLFLSEKGFIYSCGNGCNGVLGHGNYANYSQLTVIRSVLQAKFVKISCGQHHVAGIDSNCQIYTWGTSKFGELGQGDIKQRLKPTVLMLNERFKSVFCGTDCTILQTTDDELYASGKNTANKLQLNQQRTFTTFHKMKLRFTQIRHIEIMELCTILLNDRNLYVLGNHFDHPQLIQLDNISMFSTGENFVAATDCENVLWFWGTYKKYTKFNSFMSDKTLTKFNSIVSLIHSTDNKVHENPIMNEFSVETIKEPTSILALYSSKENVKNGNIIEIGNVKTKENSIFLLVNTTIKPPTVNKQNFQNY